jgi:hypothetical protein
MSAPGPLQFWLQLQYNQQTPISTCPLSDCLRVKQMLLLLLMDLANQYSMQIHVVHVAEQQCRRASG